MKLNISDEMCDFNSAGNPLWNKITDITGFSTYKNTNIMVKHIKLLGTTTKFHTSIGTELYYFEDSKWLTKSNVK